MSKSGSEIYEQYRSRMGQSGDRIKNGVLNTNKSQSGNAIKQKQRMIDNHQKAMAEGKWEEGLRRSGDEKWSRNLIEKGIGKITAGIDANKSEIVEKFEKVGRVAEMVESACADMPKGGIDNSIARVRKSIEIQQSQWGKS